MSTITGNLPDFSPSATGISPLPSTAATTFSESLQDSTVPLTQQDPAAASLVTTGTVLAQVVSELQPPAKESFNRLETWMAMVKFFPSLDGQPLMLHFLRQAKDPQRAVDALMDLEIDVLTRLIDGKDPGYVLDGLSFKRLLLFFPSTLADITFIAPAYFTPDSEPRYGAALELRIPNQELRRQALNDLLAKAEENDIDNEAGLCILWCSASRSASRDRRAFAVNYIQQQLRSIELDLSELYYNRDRVEQTQATDYPTGTSEFSPLDRKPFVDSSFRRFYAGLDGQSGLHNANYSITRLPTPRYNAFAQTIGDRDQWVYPLQDDKDMRGLTAFYAQHGFTRLNSLNIDFEPGIEKVVIFGWRNKKGRLVQITHAAVQRPDGAWSSKLGPGPEIVHSSVNAISGGNLNAGYGYGKPIAVFARPRND